MDTTIEQTTSLQNNLSRGQMRVFDEQYSQALVDAIDAPVILMTQAGHILTANGLALNMLERQPEAIVGTSFWQLLRSEPDHILHDVFESFNEQLFPLFIRLNWECSQGNCWADATLKLIPMADGNAHILCTITKLLDSYSVIEGVVHSRLFDALPQPIVISDENSLFRYCNEALLDLLGHEANDLIGQPLGSIVPPEDQEMFENRVRSRHRGYSNTYQTRILRADGEMIYVIASVSPIMDSSNTYRGTVAFITDLTSQKQAEQDLRRSNSELDAFSHTVAHDLKSPLSVLLGFADLLENEIFNISQQDAVEYLRTMGQTTQKMINIVDELLLLSQMRKADVTPVPVDMDFAVNEALMGVAYLRNQHNAHITVATDNWPQAMGYPAWIEAVWSNYISNAIKYGGQPPHIEVGATEEGDWVRYWVRDDGEGLTQEQIDLLFKPFERLHTERAKGHGIGLTIVQRIMLKLGGEVDVQSIPGEGSIFSFRLRRAIG